LSEQKLISPLLDGYVIGKPMGDHDGIRCCPALKENSEEKYIVKIISVPASQVQLDALLLTGAYKNPAEALDYFRDVAEGIVKEAELLNTMAKLEGFLPFEGWQIEPMEEGKLGYEVCLLSTYKRSLERYMRRRPITHLEAVNLGLDLCAALAICRRAGYLYVNLKPSNVFMTKQKEYRISDLGFVSLDSLMYTSLPGQYRSPYAPPETRDDMKTLNTTVDTYAAGMILYQIYNDGVLPEEPRNPKDPFPCPANADYEISAIIMKAVDPNPEKRWQTPIEMGQALVAYMQRNSVNNVPITPPTGILTPAGAVPQSSPEETNMPEVTPDVPTDASEAPETEVSIIPDVPEAEPQIPDSEPETAEDVPLIVMPEPEAESEPDDPEEALDDLDFSIAFQDLPEEDTTVQQEQPQETSKPSRKRNREKQQRVNKLKRVLITIITVMLLCLLACGAFWFYQTQYLQTIDELTIDGTQNALTVTVKTDMDERKLQVSCTDTYGNTSVQPVKNGQATFTDLLPDSLYRIELNTEGFHKLSGQTAEIFTTHSIANITAVSAVAGPVDGSVMVTFTVDGQEPDEWVITCTADGEEIITETFTGHSVTVRGLTIGKEYSLQLTTADGSEVLGCTALPFTATSLIVAEELTIHSSRNGTMDVSWRAPEDVVVDRWNVRCYNDEGHEEVLEIIGTEISFTGIDNSKAYTVEVTAAGMTNPTRVSISANPITITNLTVSTDDLDKLTVKWDYEGAAPKDGWLLMYNFAGHPDQQNVVKCETNQAVIDNRIPGATYQFVLQATDSTSVFNNTHSFSCPNADIFTNEGMTAEKLTAYLLKTPQEDDWLGEDIASDAFTDTFQSGDQISVVLKCSSNFYLPKMNIDVLYVIRDVNGYVLSDYISRETIDWKDLWYDGDYHNGELDIPAIPAESGSYNVSIYFNNLAITSTQFTIS